MGRPLKIQHAYDWGSGVANVDLGFNSFNSLVDPVIPSGMTGDQFLGVVGGFDGSANYPVIAITANVDGTEYDAFILTQKGATKYLVAALSNTAVTAIIPGQTYLIDDLGDTNWAAIGAGINPVPGDVFTATAVGTGTGVVEVVGVCILANEASGTVTQGNMQITVTVDGTSFQASKLTNKYVWDYSSPANRYAADFFAGSAADVTTAKSGAEVETWSNGTGLITLGEVSSNP